VRFEKKYYHWITDRAIKFLKDSGELRPIIKPPIHFIIHRSNRYAKRKINIMTKVIQEYSQEKINKSCGQQAENLFCLGLLKRDFSVLGEKANEFKGRKWTKTGHDLDYIFERDGIAYGSEIKNTFGYIEKNEMDVKMEMCAFLKIRPLFIMRYAPKTWINDIYKAGGYALIFETKVFELGQIDLAKKIEKLLGLPVVCSARIPEGIIMRFENWHKKQVGM